MTIEQGIENVIAELSKKVKDISPIIDALATMVLKCIQQNFNEGGRWNGSGTDIFSGGSRPWVPLAKSTIAGYKKKGYALQATLNRKGAGGLTGSTVVTGSGNKVHISNNTAYSRIHQLGGTINHPGGTAYIIVDGMARFVSNAKAKQIESKKTGGSTVIKRGLSVKSNGGLLNRTSPHTIKIPARPWATLTPEDVQQILKFLAKFVTNS